MLETDYDHVKGNDYFSVTAAEQWSIGMIRRLKKAHPDEVEILHTNPDGSMLAHLPFSWMRIVPKRKDTRTDEQKEAARQRMKAFHRSRHRAGDRENASISHD